MGSRKVPEVRFEGFEEEWEEKKLGEFVSKVKSYPLSRDVETSEDTGYKYIHYGDIHTKKTSLIDESSSLPNIKAGEYELLKKGDLIVADASEDYQGIASPSVVMFDAPYKLIAGLHTIALRIYKANHLYLYYLLNTSIFKKHGYTVGTGMKVFGISYSNLIRFNTNIPRVGEQTLIGNLFHKLDQTIALQEKHLALLKQSKKGFLQKMFPKEGAKVPEVRFSGFSGEWEEKKLGEMTIYKNGKSHEDKQSNIGTYELINLNSISIDGGLKCSGKFIYETSDTLQTNDLVMVLSDVGNGDLLGRVALIPENNRFVLNQRVALLRPKGKSIPLFLFVYINVHQKYFKHHGVGMSQLNISKGCVENFTSYVPCIEEQTLIGNFFHKLDQTISLQEKQLHLLKQTKKAFLQKMFI